MERLPMWQQRLIVLATLASMLAVVAATLLFPLLHSWQSHREWRNGALRELALARGLATQHDAYTQLVGTLNAGARPGRVWSGTADIAATSLQSDVRAMLDASHATLQTIQPLPNKQDGLFQDISYQIALTATIDQLSDLVHRIDSSTKILTLDQVVVTAPEYQDPTTNPTLSVRLNISGYVSKEAVGP